MNYTEIDPSDEEKPNQLTWINPDDHDLLYHVRSYRCSFCKRGFSNAQALGGHMNIHRKDRARLKEVSSSHENNNVRDSSNQLSLSINGDHQERCTPKRASATSSSEQEIEILNNPEKQLQSPQLSSFVKAPSVIKDEEGNGRFIIAKYANRSMQSSRHGDSLPELDLELRLGTNIPSRKG